MRSWRVIGLGMVVVILGGCISSPVPLERPHELRMPPEGKATIYFLHDWPNETRPAYGCYRGPSDLQLIVDSWAFSELRRGQWTYLYVEPVPLQFYFATRTVFSHSSPPNCVYDYASLFGDTQKIADLTPSPDSLYFFKRTPAGWEQVGEVQVREILDVRSERCRECAGRPYEDSLLIVEPPPDHYLSPRYEQIRCVAACYSEPFDGPARCSQNALSGVWDCPRKDHCDSQCEVYEKEES